MLTIEEILKMTDEERSKLHPIQVNAASLAALAERLNASVATPNVTLFLQAASLLDRVNGLVQETARRMANNILQAGGLNNPNNPIAKA